MAGQPPKTYSMDVSEPFNSTKTSSSGPSVSMGVKIGAALVAIMAFVGLVLGAYATGQVNGPTDISHVAAGRDVALTDTPNLKIHGFAFNGSIFAGSGYWTREKDMLYQRSDHATVTYNHSTIVYIFGGISNSTGVAAVNATPSNTSVILNRTVTYDTYSGNVAQLDDMPDPRARFGYAVLGDGMYIFGGFNNPDQGNTKESAPVTTMIVFNFTTLKWNTSAAQMNLPRSDICGTAANGKIYAMGGYTYTWDDTASMYSVLTTNITEVFDPATGKWTFTTPMNQNRGDCRAATLPNGMPYAIGGVHEIQPAGVDCSVDWGKCYEFLTSTEALDTTTGKWSPLAPMNRPRGDFAIDTLYDGRIFVAGGESSNGSYTHFAMYYTEEYEPDDNVWIEKAPLPEARFRFDCAGVKDRVYVFGGQPTCEIGEDIATLKCHNNGLKTTYGYFDIRRPHLYSYVRTNTRRLLRRLRA